MRRPATGHRVANRHLSDGWPPEAEREGRRPQTARADDGSRPVRCHGVAIRLFDILAAATFLAATLPILAGASVAILLNGPGPVLFRQRRVGRGGREFVILKLRTMQPGAEDRLRTNREMRDRYVQHNYKLPPLDDPRVGPVGRWLRSWSIDELPQLLNVLRGEMSLVGPRPVMPEELAIYRRFGALDTYLEVRPGMSGLWQVSGRSRLDQATRVRLDTHYVQNRSFWYYLVVVMRTPVAVLRRDGAF